MCRLASKMPRLDKFGVRAIENIRDYVYGEALIRNSKSALSLMPVPANSIVGLAKSLNLIPMSVQTLLIDYQRQMILDQTYSPPSLIPTGSNREVLAEAIRRLARRHGVEKSPFLQASTSPCSNLRLKVLAGRPSRVSHSHIATFFLPMSG